MMTAYLFGLFLVALLIWYAIADQRERDEHRRRADKKVRLFFLKHPYLVDKAIQ